MKTFSPNLYIVSTPIGNLDDITIRALDVLKKSDIILCEDTRRSIKLLNHFNIKKKLVSYHKFNEKKQTIKIIEYLNQGKILSLISDAGTPVLSDPGKILVQKCIENNIKPISIPGPSAITAAMSLSGFDDKFLFYGFLPKTEKELEKKISSLALLDYTMVFFISGVKIDFYLSSFKKYFTGRQIMIAREMTKIHETIYRSKVDNIDLFNSSIKGELTVIISEQALKTNLVNELNLKKQAKTYLKKYSLKDVVDLMVKKENISRKIIYKICLNLKNENKN